MLLMILTTFFLVVKLALKWEMIFEIFTIVGDVKISQVILCITEGTTTTNPSSPHNLDNISTPTTILLEETTDSGIMATCTCL